MTALSKELREYFKKIGAKGGSVKSEAKAEAARANGKKRTKAAKPARAARAKKGGK